MTDTAVQLKPCPFCGGPAELEERSSEWFVVACTNCLADGPYYAGEDSTSPVEAAKLWNTRATIPTKPLDTVNADSLECAKATPGHTPGPWRVDPKAESHVEAANGRSICSISYRDHSLPDQGREENVANAHLIADAWTIPALRAALEEARKDIVGITIDALETLEELGVDTTEHKKDYTATIAKIVAALTHDTEDGE